MGLPSAKLFGHFLVSEFFNSHRRLQRGKTRMPSRIVSGISLVCLALICLATPNCGNSSRSSASTPYDVVGNWQFTVSTNSGPVLYLGSIDPKGTSLFFAPDVYGVGVVDPSAFVGDTWELPVITGASSFSGASTLYAAPGTQLPSGGTSQSLSSQGTVISDSSISLTNSNGNFTLTPATPFTGTVKALSGVMTGWFNDGMAGGPYWQLAFTPTSGGGSQSMSFTTSGLATCSVAGTFMQVGTSNIFDVSMTFTGVCQFAPTGTSLTGLGFESGMDYFSYNAGQAGTYLYAEVLVPNGGAFVMEIF